MTPTQHEGELTMAEYTPSDEQVRTTFVGGASEDAYAMSWHEPYAEAYDRWLAAHDARVHRDAAREALKHFRKTELAIIPLDADEDSPIRVRQQALAWRIEMHLLANHPETED